MCRFGLGRFEQSITNSEFKRANGNNFPSNVKSEIDIDLTNSRNISYATKPHIYKYKYKSFVFCEILQVNKSNWQCHCNGLQSFRLSVHIQWCEIELSIMSDNKTKRTLIVASTCNSISTYSLAGKLSIPRDSYSHIHTAGLKCWTLYDVACVENHRLR